jgi:hypothetical protein
MIPCGLRRRRAADGARPRSRANERSASPVFNCPPTPILANGFIYTDNESGTIALLHTSETLEVVGVNKLAASVRAPPAMARDARYVRSVGHVWVFGGSC